MTAATNGASIAKTGLMFEKMLRGKMNMGHMSHASQEQVSFARRVCEMRGFDFEILSQGLSFEPASSKEKSDVILRMDFVDGKSERLGISIKGISGQTQFALMSVEDFVSEMEPLAAEGYRRYVGSGEYAEEWKREYGHEDRSRYYWSELSPEIRLAMRAESQKPAFVEKLVGGLYGKEGSEVSIVVSPKDDWDESLMNLQLIDVAAIKRKIIEVSACAPYAFMDPYEYDRAAEKVICKLGGRPPNGEGGLSFLDGLIIVKRKGSEIAGKNGGFDPTSIQIMSSTMKQFNFISHGSNFR